jgi:dienelactone hydrolase
MPEVVLFHHALGLTLGVREFANELRRNGHVVHIPDLFEGRVFADIDSGVAYVDEMGFDAFTERGVESVDGLSNEVVYAGFSLGVLPAQRLAQTRLGASGALLFEACTPVTQFGAGWPEGLPVQVHGMEDDALFAGEGDIDAARALVAEADGNTRAELFLYAGDQHLFADTSLRSYSADAATLMTRRVLAFLGDL